MLKAGMGTSKGGRLSGPVGDVSLSTAAIASSKYAVLTDVCFVVAAEVKAESAAGVGGGGIDRVGRLDSSG
jgi:hypothetical protein